MLPAARRSLASFAFALFAACSSPAGQADAAPVSDPRAPLATAPDDAGLYPLSHYLAGAAALRLYRFDRTHGRQFVATLAADATKAYLARLDLTQKADGPLVRCPPDTHYELIDAAGKTLGTIGFCRDAARFDGPDGKFGGIRAERL